MKILVVDDAAFIRKTLTELITNLGHEVIEASNGEDAVFKSKRELPDVIVMDVVMPKMDGITALKIMKDSANTPVIMCTAVGDKKNIIEALKAGANDYITKPVDSSRLEAALGRAIESNYL